MSSLGWRLSRRVDARGLVCLDWRCPTCAERHRKLRALVGASSSRNPAVRRDSRPPPSHETKPPSSRESKPPSGRESKPPSSK